MIEVTLWMRWESNGVTQSQAKVHRSPPCNSNSDDIDNKADQCEQYARLFETGRIYGTTKSGIPADNEIGHKRTERIIGADSRKRIIIERPNIASRAPEQHRAAGHNSNQQAIEQGELLPTQLHSKQQQP